MGGSISIKNDTDLPLLISLEQITPLYWQVVQPGDTFFRNTGAVHFTIKAKVASQDTINVLKDCVLPIAAVSAMSVGTAGLAIVAIPLAAGIGVGAGVTAGVMGVQEAVALTTSAVGGALMATGSLVSYAAIITNILIQKSTKTQCNQLFDDKIQSDEIKELIAENLKKEHYRVKKLGYYAGYNHKLKITGGINLQKLLLGQYEAENLLLSPKTDQ